MSFVVCIPSYKRSQLCNDQTLTTLNKHKIDAKFIYVFVANKSEYDDYKKVLNPDFYNKLILGKKGLVQQRDYISNYFQNVLIPFLVSVLIIILLYYSFIIIY